MAFRVETRWAYSLLAVWVQLLSLAGIGTLESVYEHEATRGLSFVSERVVVTHRGDLTLAKEEAGGEGCGLHVSYQDGPINPPLPPPPQCCDLSNPFCVLAGVPATGTGFSFPFSHFYLFCYCSCDAYVWVCTQQHLCRGH